MQQRIGIFFIIIGAFALILFWISVQAQAMLTRWLLLGLMACALGIFLWNKGRDTTDQPQHFRLIRKITSRKQDNE